MKAICFHLSLGLLLLACKEDNPPLQPVNNPPIQQNPPCRIQYLEYRSGTEISFEQIYFDSAGVNRVNLFGFNEMGLHFYYDTPLRYKCYYLSNPVGADTTGKRHVVVEKLPNGRLSRISDPFHPYTQLFTHHPNDSVYISLNGQAYAVAYFDARGNETYWKKVSTGTGQLSSEEHFMTYDASVNPFGKLGYDYWLYLGQSKNNLQKLVIKVNGISVKEQHFELKYDTQGRLTSMTDTLNNNFSVRIMSYYPCP